MKKGKIVAGRDLKVHEKAFLYALVASCLTLAVSLAYLEIAVALL